MKFYARWRLKEMKTYGLWTELGLHRGLIAEEEKTRETGPSQGITTTYQYYNLGDDQLIGLFDERNRMALHRTHLSSKPWFAEWDMSDKRGKIDGPVLSHHNSHGTLQHMRILAKDAIAKIKEGLNKKPSLGGPIGKPRFKMKNQIAYEDRPDAGFPPNPSFKPKLPKKGKPTLPIRKPPPFKIKGHRDAQADTAQEG